MRASYAAAIGCVLLAAAACDKVPAGKADVAARVYGDKITVPQLDAELKAANVPNPNDPEIRREALQRIIVRKLLAKSAHDQKLDKDPSYPALKAATIEGFEAGLAQKAALDKVAPPTAQEASAFISQHPEMFAQRTVYLVEELVVGQAPDQSLLDALRPLNDLAAIEKLLQDRRLPYRRAVDQIDTLRVDSNLSRQIASLPAGAAFVLPGPNGFAVARVRDSKVQPVSGDAATNVANTVLTAQRRQKAVQDAIDALKSAAKTNISYGEGFAPPAPPAKN